MAKQNPAPTEPKAVDVRAYHPLARLRRVIRAYVTLEGVFSALILVGLWFWAALALDFGLHYFFGVDLLQDARPVRFVLISLLGAGVLASIVFLILRRIFRDFRSAALALVLEKRFPELLGDRLITAVELADLKKAARIGYSTEMIVKTMKDAQQRVNSAAVRSVFNWRRLWLLGWTFLGVTALVLLLTYPLAVLASLKDVPRGEALYRMLAINGLLLLNVAFLFALPFAGRRLARTVRRPALVLVPLALLCAGTTAAGFYYALSRANTMRFNDYAWNFYHAADITLDRNLKFKDTRWPADDYYVELLDFPVPVKRVELRKDVTVRGVFDRFVVADAAAPTRWRPARWADLENVLPDENGEKLPELPLERVHAYMKTLADGDESSPVGYDHGALEFPGAGDVRVDLVLAAVADPALAPPLFTDDERRQFAALEARLVRRAADPKLGGRLLRNVPPPDRLVLVYTNLEYKDGVLVPKDGSGGEVDLLNFDARRNVYEAKLPKLEEPVSFYVEARVGDRRPRSVERTVDLVLAPKMTAITYQEFRPAYYYYLPPYGQRNDNTIDDERRKSLRGFRQALGAVRTERPPERTAITIALGSELVVSGSSDKPLQEVTLTPLSETFPGLQPGEARSPIRLQVNPDGVSFTAKFRAGGHPIREHLAQQWAAANRNLVSAVLRRQWLAALSLAPIEPADELIRPVIFAALEAVAPQVVNDLFSPIVFAALETVAPLALSEPPFPVRQWLAHLPVAPAAALAYDEPAFPLITKSADFEITLKDADNMTSTKSVFVKPTEDAKPDVNLYVEVIRKVKGTYMCTAKAEIPFAKESFASDDNGLHRVEFTYEYTTLASSTVTSQRAEMAAWLWASSPLQPTIADYLYRREILLRTVGGVKGAPPVTGTFPLKAFDEALLAHANKFVPTVEQLRALTHKPLEGNGAPPLNRYEFRNADRAGGAEAFDLLERLPQLAAKDAVSGAQPSFRLIVNVRVTDSNVLADADRTAENKDGTLEFRVVPEDELAAEISREEVELARKFDDVIKRLEAGQRNLQAVASRSPALTRETAVSEQTRVEGVLEALAKAKELTGEVSTDYARILREYIVNRFPELRTSNIKRGIIDPMTSVQAVEFPEAEAELNKFHATVRDGDATLASQQAGPTVLKVQQLIDKLKQIQQSLGQVVGLNEAAAKLKRIIEGQEGEVRKEIEGINSRLIDELLNIRVALASETITLAPGATQKVTVKLKMPETILSDPFLRFEIPANSGLKVNPPEIRLKDDAKDASFDVTAGGAPGNYSLRIVPSQGKPIDLKVVVK
jgi:hypothetical protein